MINALSADRSSQLRELGNRLLELWFLACFLASIAGTVWVLIKFGVSLAAILLALGWIVGAGVVIFAIRKQAWILAGAVIVLLRAGMYSITAGIITQTPDPHYYHVLATHIAQGRDFTDIVSGVPLRAHAPRLYSLLLGGLYAITDGSRFSPFLLNAIVDSLTGFVIFLTCRQLGTAFKTAVALGALYMIWPHIVVASAFAQKEGLASLLLMAGVWTLLLTWSDGQSRAVRYGIFLGLLGLCQPAWFPLGAGLPLLLFLSNRRSMSFKFLGIAALTTVLVMLPWIIRNWIVTGGFIPLTSSFGLNLYVNASRTMHFPESLSHLSETVWNMEMAKAGFAIIVADPAAYLTHEVRMIATSFALEHGQYFNLMGLNPAPAISPENFLLVMQLPLIAMWSGALWSFRHRKVHSLFIGIFAIILAYIATVCIWFEFGARHRAFLLPLILCVVGSALQGLTARTTAAMPDPQST